MFSNPIPKVDREAIRTATNKAWDLGNDRFKAKKCLNRQMQKNHAVGIGGLKYLRVNRVSIESDPIGFDPIGFDPIGFDPIGFDPIGFDPIGFNRV